MVDWFYDLFANTNSFMPHGACYLWLPAILWLHVVSDVLIALAYYSIPFALWYFVHKRTDLVYRWVFVLFGVFILLCGTTHLMSIWTIWRPDYWLDGLIKFATALVSIAAALLIWPLMPKLLKLPSPKALKTSEAYIRAIFDATPDAMIISNTQGVITMVNQQAENLLGYQSEELIGQPVEVLIPENYRAVHPAHRNQFAAAPYVRSMGKGFVVLALKKDGTEFDVDISLSPIKTDQGLLFASSLRDVTLQKQAEAALKVSEDRFRRMADASPAMIWITDINGNPTFVNQTWLNFTGIELRQAMTHEGWIQLIHPDDRETIFKEYYTNILEHKTILTEYRMRCAKGDWRWILDQGVPVHNECGEFNGYVGSAIDITERKLAEAEFRIAATAFESQEAMVITDTNTVILRVNKTFTDSTGYTAEEAVGQKMNLLKSGRHDDAFYAKMWDCLHRTGAWQGEIWDRRKNGEVYPKFLTITAVKDAANQVTHYVGTHIDISERKAAEEEIKHLAFYDPLTKLPNRRLLMDRLHQSLANYARTGMYGALLFIDMDNFKILNDTLGHDTGDLFLQEVANRLLSSVRQCDTVARLGGDEFVIMLEYLSEKSSEAAVLAESVGEKIIGALNQPYQLKEFEYQCTPSIGATLFSEQDNRVDELLKQADIAMYQAKAVGRIRCDFLIRPCRQPSWRAPIWRKNCAVA